MTDEQVQKYLDHRDWIKYKNGTEKFKQAIRLGLRIQLAQINNFFKKHEN